MFQQLPSIWKRDAVSEQDARYSRRILRSALCVASGVMLAHAVATIIRHVR